MHAGSRPRCSEMRRDAVGVLPSSRSTSTPKPRPILSSFVTNNFLLLAIVFVVCVTAKKLEKPADAHLSAKAGESREAEAERNSAASDSRRRSAANAHFVAFEFVEKRRGGSNELFGKRRKRLDDASMHDATRSYRRFARARSRELLGKRSSSAEDDDVGLMMRATAFVPAAGSATRQHRRSAATIFNNLSDFAQNGGEAPPWSSLPSSHSAEEADERGLPLLLNANARSEQHEATSVALERLLDATQMDALLRALGEAETERGRGAPRRSGALELLGRRRK